jgi:type IV pilus assembly protein PilE
MQTQKGFSLIELMIVAVIVGILAAVAIPSYQSYVVKGNRAAAQAFMVDVANREKQYLLDARSYAADLATLGMTPPTDVSKHYPIANIIIAVSSPPPTFTITATPTSAQQAADGELTLTSDGIKGPADKW